MNVVRRSLAALAALGLGLASVGAHAATVIADWTFETSVPLTAGPFAAEIGAGTATGFHAGASTYSSPAGDGSAHSFSSNTWAVGDYYQFQVSTLGVTGITLSWDQTGSSTGPRDFILQYSTDGVNFTAAGANYSVLVNGTPNTAWSATGAYNPAFNFTRDLSSITALDGVAALYLRIVDNSTTALNGTTVAAGGTGRVDNFTVSANSVNPVPVPAAVWLLGSGLAGLAGLRRRRADA